MAGGGRHIQDIQLTLSGPDDSPDGQSRRHPRGRDTIRSARLCPDDRAFCYQFAERAVLARCRPHPSQ